MRDADNGVGRERANREEKIKRKSCGRAGQNTHSVHVLNKAFHSHRRETKYLNTLRPNR